WGTKPVLGDSRWNGFQALFRADGRPMKHEDSPMALAIREKHEVRDIIAFGGRPDGTRVLFKPFPTPIFNAAGDLVGAINTLIDLSSQQDADALGLRMSAVVDSSFDAIVSKDLNSVVTTWNEAAEKLFGYSAEEMIGQHISVLFPDDRLDEETNIIGRIQRGERVETFETVRRRKDGTLIPVSLTVSPIKDPTGQIVGASKIARDISANKDSERRIRLLMREVNHRVKNQYAVILSMIRETNKRAVSSADFERQVRERIMALSRSHDLLVLGEWKGTTIFELLLSQVTPFGSEEAVNMSGPSLMLNPNAVQYLGIAFHELATNSAKYGVLAGKKGTISIAWKVAAGAEGERRLFLTWRETGGKPVVKEKGRGFGTVVLERVAPQALSGTGAVSYDNNELIWTLEAPMLFVEPSIHAD
ncbi:MAG TPA: PAS domain S-box protein, partial [Rhizobiaceae bacterium]|nr:PAS domain S-box protein [Rhizobiaceae bacterium]